MQNLRKSGENVGRARNVLREREYLRAENREARGDGEQVHLRADEDGGRRKDREVEEGVREVQGADKEEGGALLLRFAVL